MNVLRIPYASTHRFQPIVLDLLAGVDRARGLVLHSPDLQGLSQAARERVLPADAKWVLVDALERQYAGMAIQPAVREQLNLLQRPDALTVCTGHQLCLFTGPLYLPLKILNCIRLARNLTRELGRPIVPVFWMATEDHDRAEVDHAWIKGHRVHWPGEPGGAVGRMLLKDIGPVVEQAIGLLEGSGTDDLATLLRACYRPELTLTEATRRFVDALFGRFGLVILDGDDPALKQRFVPYMQEELLHQVTSRTVDHAVSIMAPHYKAQAHPRDINLFQLRPGHRSRITLEGDAYQVLDGGAAYTAAELLADLERNPQDYSPNVLMRPLFQEVVLPNIAYVGGGGELAYWMQLRWLFQGMQVPMPVTLLRTSVAFLSGKHWEQWKELGLSAEDLFADVDLVKNRVAVARADFRVDMEEEVNNLNTLFDRLVDRARPVDPTLIGAIEAGRKRSLKRLDRLAHGFKRAARHRQEVEMERISRIHEALLPNGGLQERRENILPRLAAHGLGALDELLESLDPLDGRFSVFVEG